MNLKELKEKIDFIYKTEKEPENVCVFVTLIEPSIGGRAKMEVKHINMGFDWEHSQLRIEPAEGLVRKDKDKQTAIPVKERLSFDKTCKVFCCPICDGHLNKNDKYCKFCGQKLK